MQASVSLAIITLIKREQWSVFYKTLIVSNLVQFIFVTSDRTYFVKVAVIWGFILFQIKVVKVGIISKKIEKIIQNMSVFFLSLQLYPVLYINNCRIKGGIDLNLFNRSHSIWNFVQNCTS